MDQNLRMTYDEQQKEIAQQIETARRIELAEEERLQNEREKNAGFFRSLAPASLIYTLVYTICIYKNISGITMPLWVAATIGYACYAVKIAGKKRKKDSIFYMTVMLLLGISTFTTGNENIIWLNYPIFFVLLIGFLLYNLWEEDDWDFDTYVWKIVKAVAGAAWMIAKPFEDAGAFLQLRKNKKDRRGYYIVFGICLAIPCLLFLGMMLMKADMVFATIVSGVLNGFHFSARILGILFMLCFGFLSSYCGISYVMQKRETAMEKREIKGEPVFAITVTVMIAVMYLIFCAIQILYLFVGNMQLPDGITYAEYARTGFFQLLFVCMLNLVLVIEVKKYFRKHQLLDVILLVISFCTLIMTASSAWRMLLYVKAYHLTFLRVTVLVALFVIALLMTGVVWSILHPAFPLFRYGMAVVSAVYLLFAFSHIDYFIASYNLNQMSQSQRSDTQMSDNRMNDAQETVDNRYISCLSTDAAPAIAAYRKEHPDTFGAYMAATQEERSRITLRNFNLSHYIAYRLLGKS